MTIEINDALYQQRLSLAESASNIRRGAAEQYFKTGVIDEKALELADKLKETAFEIQVAQSQQSS